MNHIKLFENYISDGNKIVYHGTNKKFDSFDFSLIGKGSGRCEWGYGFYFTENLDDAIYYAKYATEKSKGNPYLYSVNIKGLNLYELDYNESLKLPENEINNILYHLKKIGKPEIIKKVRVFHSDYDDIENDNKYDDYIFDGSNGNLIIDKWIERTRNSFYLEEYAYSSKSFFKEFLYDYFMEIDFVKFKELTSKFLQSCGYDGISYIDDINIRGFVLFSPPSIINREKLD